MLKIALIIAADEPALFYSSISDAEMDLEAIDVRDGVYTAAFGPNGEPYSISTEGERVIIRPTGEAPQPEALKALLVFYLKAVGKKPIEEADLSSLLKHCKPEIIQEASPTTTAAVALTIGLPLVLIFMIIYALS